MLFNRWKKCWLQREISEFEQYISSITTKSLWCPIRFHVSLSSNKKIPQMYITTSKIIKITLWYDLINSKEIIAFMLILIFVVLRYVSTWQMPVILDIFTIISGQWKMMKLKTLWRNVKLKLTLMIIHFSEKNIITHLLTHPFLTKKSKLKIWINVKTDQKLVDKVVNLILLVFIKTSQPFLSIAVDFRKKI